MLCLGKKNKTKQNQVMSLFTVRGLAIGKSLLCGDVFLLPTFLNFFFSSVAIVVFSFL